MKRKIFNLFVALSVITSVLSGNVLSTKAAETQEVQGTTAQQKQVEITADVKAVYSVSLPATITLEYQTVSVAMVGDFTGYWTRLKYGVAGIIPASRVVYVKPQFPCTLSMIKEGQEPVTIDVIDIRDQENERINGTCKTEWSSSEVGSCDYDGTTVSNCNYSYCCSDGHWIGVNDADIPEGGIYTGNMVFNFGIKLRQ